MGKPDKVGAYANQRLNLTESGKVQGRIMAKTPNRTGKIRPSGIIGGLRKRGYGGIVTPPRNRKSEDGNPPPTADAPELYPNQNRPTCGGNGPQSDLRRGLLGVLIWFPTGARHA